MRECLRRPTISLRKSRTKTPSGSRLSTRSSSTRRWGLSVWVGCVSAGMAVLVGSLCVDMVCGLFLEALPVSCRDVSVVSPSVDGVAVVGLVRGSSIHAMWYITRRSTCWRTLRRRQSCGTRRGAEGGRMRGSRPNRTPSISSTCCFRHSLHTPTPSPCTFTVHCVPSPSFSLVLRAGAVSCVTKHTVPHPRRYGLLMCGITRLSHDDPVFKLIKKVGIRHLQRRIFLCFENLVR